MNNIIIKSHNFEVGLFCIISYILKVLPIFEEKNIDKQNIYWDITGIYYDNIFPNILEYELIKNYEMIKNDENTQIFDLEDITYGFSSQEKQFHLGNDFLGLNKLFFKYFTIPQDILDLVNTYELTHYLGLHYRGTDKFTDTEMNTPISIYEYKIIIDSYIKVNNITHIFLSTDEGELFTYFTTKYPLITIKTSRDMREDLFWQNSMNYVNNAREAMIDMLCLSKCNTILKTSSALSAYAKIINPNINIYRINASIYTINDKYTDTPYFPDSYIPLLECNEKYSVECNEILIQKQRKEPILPEKYKNVVYVEL
jgi:hypothetical protein